MRLRRATQFSSVLLLALACMQGAGSDQTVPAPLAAVSPAAVAQRVASNLPARAYPSLHLWRGHDLVYLGMFSADAVFRSIPRFARPTSSVPGEEIRPAPSRAERTQSVGAPASMLLSNERVVEDFEPPAHAEAVAQAPAPLAAVRNHFITYAYGRPSVLHAPHDVVSDSHHRLIVSDPDVGAVHVLDPRGTSSFRIMTGKGHRLHQPAAVAVDGEDNIYVADPDLGMVIVFDRNGIFLRNLGDFHGEPQFAAPHGVAIDLRSKRLYLADTPRNLIVVLDLAGNIRKQIGKLHDGTGVGEFDHPTDIAINHNHVFVLDRMGTRVQVFDMACSPVGSFDLPHGLDPRLNSDNGLSADGEGNVYVSWPRTGYIRVYSYDGHLLSSFGQPGIKVGEFESPSGLWIDSANRLYVADAGNGRVQLFQLKPAQ